MESSVVFRRAHLDYIFFDAGALIFGICLESYCRQYFSPKTIEEHVKSHFLYG